MLVSQVVEADPPQVRLLHEPIDHARDVLGRREYLAGVPFAAVAVVEGGQHGAPADRVRGMECEPASISCELGRVADALTTFDPTQFFTTLTASVLGLLIPIVIAFFVFRGEIRARREERREDAIVRVIDAIDRYCRDVWEHQHRIASLDVMAAGNLQTNRGQFNPKPPSTDGIENAISAARVILSRTSDLHMLSQAWLTLRALDSESNLESRSSQFAFIAREISDAVRKRTA